MASSSVLNVLTARTGPKTSSLHICMEVFTSEMMVGSTKYPFFKCWQAFYELEKVKDFRRGIMPSIEKQRILPQDDPHHTK